MWRHGDVFIAAVVAIPDGAVRRTGWVLAEGEATGHSHRIERPETVELYERDGMMYLRVVAELAHGGPPGASGDHASSGYVPGLEQGEYSPEAIRTVRLTRTGRVQQGRNRR